MKKNRNINVYEIGLKTFFQYKISKLINVQYNNCFIELMREMKMFIRNMIYSIVKFALDGNQLKKVFKRKNIVQYRTFKYEVISQ